MKKSQLLSFFGKKYNIFLLKIIIFLLFFMIFVFFLHFWIKHNLMVNKLYGIQSIGQGQDLAKSWCLRAVLNVTSYNIMDYDEKINLGIGQTPAAGHVKFSVFFMILLYQIIAPSFHTIGLNQPKNSKLESHLSI